MGERIDFYVDQRIFSLNTLKIFSEETGTNIMIKNAGIMRNGIFESECMSDKLCKSSCREHTECHIKMPELYYPGMGNQKLVKDD